MRREFKNETFGSIEAPTTYFQSNFAEIVLWQRMHKGM